MAPRRSSTWRLTFSRSPSVTSGSSASKTTRSVSSTLMRAPASAIPARWMRLPSLIASCSTSCPKGSARCVTTAASAPVSAPPCRPYATGSPRRSCQTQRPNCPWRLRHRPPRCAAPSASSPCGGGDVAPHGTLSAARCRDLKRSGYVTTPVSDAASLAPGFCAARRRAGGSQNRGCHPASCAGPRPQPPGRANFRLTYAAPGAIMTLSYPWRHAIRTTATV